MRRQPTSVSGVPTGCSVADTKSSDVDVVTQPDRESEALIRRLVLERRPGDAFLGEETGTAAGSSGVRWVVDPIDGTVNYLYGLPEYSVSIAAEVDGEVVAGVVVNAATGVEYVATAGDARRDGVPLGVRGPAPVAPAAGDHRLRLRRRQARRPGGGRRAPATRLCETSAGSARAPWTSATSPRAAPTPTSRRACNLWDYAAGAFIAAQAGARWELHPGAYGTPALVAAPAHGFEEFLDAVRDAGFLAPGRPLRTARTPRRQGAPEPTGTRRE